jgi:hypothetical protein
MVIIVLGAFLIMLVIFATYAKIFELAWNKVVPHMFHMKTLSFVESASLIFVLSTIGALLLHKQNVFIQYSQTLPHSKTTFKGKKQPTKTKR